MGNTKAKRIIFIVAVVFFVLLLIRFLYFPEAGAVGNGVQIFFMGIAFGTAVYYLINYALDRKNKVDEYLFLYNEKLTEVDLLKDQVMEAEYAFSQAQIRPHFLYNALNTIVNVCENDGKKGGKLILDLAIYLQNSLMFNQLNKMTTVEKEMEFIDTYFRIEEARFGNKIKLLKEIKVGLDERIPVFLLQPLVENAVRHGITKKTEGGTVTLKIKRLEEGLCIEVEDDGIGMDAVTLECVFSKDQEGECVGLRNINNRLEYLYGCELSIVSSAESGTCVRIVIPEKSLS